LSVKKLRALSMSASSPVMSKVNLPVSPSSMPLTCCIERSCRNAPASQVPKGERELSKPNEPSSTPEVVPSLTAL
jgi:hypothetical protein